MENELVKETKDICKSIYKLLAEKHAELKLEGAGTRILNSIVEDMNEAINIYTSVNEENVIDLHVKVLNLQDSVEYTYNFEKVVPEEQDEEEIEDFDNDEEKKEETKEETKEEKKEDSRVATAIFSIGLGAAAVLSCIGLDVMLSSKKEKENVESASNVETVEETESNVRVIGAKEKSVSEETKAEEVTESTEETLVLGEYGTFLDVTNEEQVNARSEYIFNNYFANNQDLTDQQKELITVENIANTIRIMNGELPINEEGYEFYDGMTLNEYTNVLVEAAINSGSNVNDKYTYFPTYLLAVDGSEESEFIKSYSVIYDKLIYALNEHDDEQVQDAIACLGYKFYNEWYLQGMYGDTNPHLFRTDLKYLTFISTIEPYNTTAREWHLSEKKPVCIYACKDYETGEKQLVSVNDIVVALETGAWNNIGAKLGGMDVEPTQWLSEYYEALNDTLSWKYDHRQALTLK